MVKKIYTKTQKITNTICDSTLMVSSLAMSFVNPIVGLPALGVASYITAKDIRKYGKKRKKR